MADDPPLVLVVDDEQSYRDALSVTLQREGFLVVTAADGAEAIERFDATRPALILLDVMLPKISGIDVCREIRSRSRVPIIMVTARNGEIDAVVGLEVGADDYVSKPFRLRELTARVRAALRRVPSDMDPEQIDRPDQLEVGDVRVDTARHEVWVRGDIVALPLKEFELLEFLLTNAGRVLTRDVLIDRIWGPNYFGDTKTLVAHRDRARRRLPVREAARLSEVPRASASMRQQVVGDGGEVGDRRRDRIHRCDGRTRDHGRDRDRDHGHDRHDRYDRYDRYDRHVDLLGHLGRLERFGRRDGPGGRGAGVAIG